LSDGFFFCVFLFFGFLAYLNRQTEIAQTSTGIEDRCEQNRFEDPIDVGGKLPIRHQNEIRDHVYRRSNERNQGKYEIGRGRFACDRHSRIVEQEECKCGDRKETERVIVIPVIIGGIQIRPDQECYTPDGSSQRKHLFCVFKAGISCGVQDEIRGTEENEQMRENLRALIEGISKNLRKIIEIEENENADGKKDEAEKGTCEYGKLVLGCGKAVKLKFSQQDGGRQKSKENKQEHESEGSERGLCFDSIFVSVGVIIADDHHRSPNGKDDSRKNGEKEITE